MLKVSLVGRPNVGKSTLFNRLTGTNHAITFDFHGVTRDYREGRAKFSGVEFILYDTAGFEKEFLRKASLTNNQTDLGVRMFEHTVTAIKDSDLILLMIDGLVGITSEDQLILKFVKELSKPYIVVVNKCENRKAIEQLKYDLYGMGLDNFCFISSEHSLGFVDLFEEMQFYIEQDEKLNLERDARTDGQISIAIIGRPNAGKSTLLNQLIGKNRMLTGPEAGITRDSIAVDATIDGQSLKLIDTAGLRKKSNVVDQLEKLSYEDSLRAIRYANIVILLLDSEIALEKQDLSLASHAIDEGRGIILAFNKIDKIEDLKSFKEEIEHMVPLLLPRVANVPCLYISALNGLNTKQLIKYAKEVYLNWQKRISTAKLNEWLQFACEKHPLPLGKGGKRLKIKYITEGKSRPPTFYLFTNRPKEIPDSYLQYLNNSLRQYFGFVGVPIRMYFRKESNPYKN